MNYLSPQIEALVKKKFSKGPSLVKKGHSCGIFQDYDTAESRSNSTSKD